jgi:hypothetical protein
MLLVDTKVDVQYKDACLSADREASGWKGFQKVYSQRSSKRKQ